MFTFIRLIMLNLMALVIYCRLLPFMNYTEKRNVDAAEC